MLITFGKAFEPFVQKRPICVMARGVLGSLLNSERIDGLFERTAEVQYTRDLMFSSVVELMGSGGSGGPAECSCCLSSSSRGAWRVGSSGL